jgi:exodeoxyribonuclease-5
MTDFSPDQARALVAIEAFLRDPCRRTFILHGLAGTGKSFLLAELVRRHPEMHLTAFTGKAASVLRRRVGVPVSTLHQAIYRFKGLADDDDGRKRPVFDPLGHSAGLFDDVLLVDEVSMVGGRVAEDALATGARIIASGDPGQLPPVRDAQYFTEPDATLTTIHRQALDSPIIRQAHNVRFHDRYEADGDGFRVVAKPTEKDLLAADAILCWRNSTRRLGNRRMRSLRGLSGPLVVGEPAMCLRNDHRIGVLNGEVYRIIDRQREGMVVEDDLGERRTVQLAAVEGEDGFDDRCDDEDWTPFAPAYVATVHKYQGSSADDVVLYDEAERDWRAYTYTGITRAVKRCTVVKYR